MKDVATRRPDKPLRPLADLLMLARDMTKLAQATRPMGSHVVPCATLDAWAAAIRDSVERLIIAATPAPQPPKPSPESKAAKPYGEGAVLPAIVTPPPCS